MAPNGNDRSMLLTVGGVLSIVAGVFQISRGVLVAVDLLYWSRTIRSWEMNWEMFIWGCVGVLGIVAVVGGISAVRRKSFGLSLAGAICALPSFILGIMAIIFVSVSKIEFEA